MKSKTPKSKKEKKKISVDQGWEAINPQAAGIDIGAKEHFACVPAKATPKNVRSFGTCTADLNALADWFKECGVTSVAMEATGVYWIPVFQILEERGLAVILVNARQTKNVAGRKSDVQDCQWIQRLHTYGLLQGSFRPEDAYCVLRTYLRYRDELVSARSTQCQHMQKALQQMNVQLVQVLSDVMGVSGMTIIQAILEGKRDPVKLANMVDRRVRATPIQIQKALEGDYREEHLFVLQQAFLYSMSYAIPLFIGKPHHIPYSCIIPLSPSSGKAISYGYLSACRHVCDTTAPIFKHKPERIVRATLNISIAGSISIMLKQCDFACCRDTPYTLRISNKPEGAIWPACNCPCLFIGRECISCYKATTWKYFPNC